MQKIDPENVEMIRRREKNGFCFTYRSFLAEKVEKTPSPKDLESLAAADWWGSGSVISGFVNSHDAKPASADTRLRIVYDDETIFAGFYMEEPEMAETRTLVMEQGTRKKRFPVDLDEKQASDIFPYVINKDDTVELMLDFGFKRKRYVQFLTNMAGVHFADEVESNYTEMIHPANQYIEKWAGEYQSDVFRGKDFWCAGFAIPWKSVGIVPEAAGIMGINAKRGRSIGEYHKHMLSFAPSYIISAFDFGHLYFGNKPFEVEEADFGHPVLDWNTVRLKVKNPSDGELQLNVTTEVAVDSIQEIVCSEKHNARIGPGQSVPIELKYKLDMREPRIQTLRINFADTEDSHKEITFCYELGMIGASIPADYRGEFFEVQPDPASEDPDFIKKKMNYFQSRIPRFERRTTNHGAPSDFTLSSTCGRYEFNLMKSGVLTDIADMIAEIFDDQTDRLCALVLLARQNAFSRPLSLHVALHKNISPLSALRLNGGHCFTAAMIWLGIAKELKSGKGGGERYGDRVHAMLIMGHVIGAVETEDGKDLYMFDPSFGTYYFRWDNQTLATRRELCQDHGLVERVLRSQSKSNGFVNPQCHTLIPHGAVVFPQLAPAH